MRELNPEDHSAKDSFQAEDDLDSLSAEEKAAFEKIMAEISAVTGKSVDGIDPVAAGKPAGAPAGAGPPANPSRQLAPIEPAAVEQENQPVAQFDQVMAEIASKRQSPAVQSRPAEDENDLPAERKADLNHILAEIDSKRKSLKKGPESLPEAEDKSDGLSPDQQTALNQIMAEIEEKRTPARETGAKAQEQNDPAADQDGGPVGILAEVDDRKAGATSTTDHLVLPAEDPGEGPVAALSSNTKNLTVEEFDAELNQLIMAAKASDPGEASGGNDVSTPAVLLAEAEQAAPTAAEYQILQEVKVEPAAPPAGKGRARRFAGVFKIYPMMVIILAACGLAGYFAYQLFYYEPVASHPPDHVTADPSKAAVQANIVEDLPQAENAAPEAWDPPQQVRQRVQPETPAMLLAGLKRDLSAARDHIQRKISDIEQLKSYYQGGIGEEVEQIEGALVNGRIPSFENALGDKKIELALRAIQRRKTYMDKLQAPLSELRAAAEELLFFERRAHLLEILSGGMAGLPLEEFRQEVAGIIAAHQQFQSHLSVDRLEVATPSLSSVWDEVSSRFTEKANQLAQRAPLNRAVGKEICQGKFDRTYQLTALSEETAVCLARWPGKDLYLNGLSELTPDAARLLSGWRGEWLSLNGIKDLPPETASHLAQWPGRRLSLNGLSTLTPEATEYLSQWRGAHLELVGLRSIGSWKNYGTRLFLSETLRRQLETQ